ncbi:conserved hypothetical protein [Xanthomonas citri pv. citri]|uniref:Uncharacterized protein n=1 Tax=Xanthomonas citri pv. citri TaxID=611301 RepID=A0A0U5FBW0_XANCI|nr:conserved hypothetical protein [Xanthomonas citri pv. citri]CEJ43049.1 conserved hypothetical protein [Xanthomonas citri pv. bilvae]CEE23910.1 conserved hypothetical protein [Xanthomonas citri pv. citri]CEE25513.1 conserved hypothetical protein [Xanthomonas citri pv. citri]CEE33888.1 conserved hypothetical protein [Xanthomonas citri pv. citri]
MVAVVMMVVMPVTHAPTRSSGWQRSEAMAEALPMHAKDITGTRPVKRCVNGQVHAPGAWNRKPCRSGI